MDANQRQAWVKRVLGVAVSEPGGGISADMMAERLQIIAEDARTYGLLDPIAGEMRDLAQALKEKAAGVGTLLGKLEDRMADLIKRRRMEQVRDEADKSMVSAQAGLVGFAKLRLELVAARGAYGQAVFNLGDACRALLKTGDFVGDPRSTAAETLAAIDSIGERVPDIATLVGSVEDAIDGMAAATDPAARKTLVDRVLGEIDTYHQAVDAEPILKMMESSAAGAFAIHSALVGALDGLSSALRA